MANQLYQYSIVSALMDGVASGGIELSALAQLGDHGLGTFESIDGEMVMIDSKAYHLRADGSIEIATEHNKLPFAMVTSFKPTKYQSVSLPDKDAVFTNVKSMFSNSSNLYLSMKIEGAFQRIKVRAVKGQKYPGLLEEHKSSKHQANQSRTTIVRTRRQSSRKYLHRNQRNSVRL